MKNKTLSGSLDDLRKSCQSLKNALFNAFEEKIKMMPEKKIDSPLDKISEMNAVCREYYGDDNVKPNSHCYWVDSEGGIRRSGWYETDDRLRKRVLKSIDERTIKTEQESGHFRQNKQFYIQDFLFELANLQEKYDMAICTRDSKSSVVYQNSMHESFNTGRCHSTAYETRLLAGVYKI